MCITSFVFSSSHPAPDSSRHNSLIKLQHAGNLKVLCGPNLRLTIFSRMKNDAGWVVVTSLTFSVPMPWPPALIPKKEKKLVSRQTSGEKNKADGQTASKQRRQSFLGYLFGCLLFPSCFGLHGTGFLVVHPCGLRHARISFVYFLFSFLFEPGFMSLSLIFAPIESSVCSW